MKYILLSLFTLFIYSDIISQEHICHGDIDLEKSAEFQKLLNQMAYDKSYGGQRPMVRLALHNVRRDDGTGGYNWINIKDVVQGISAYFSPFDICFTVVLENDIHNTTYYDIPYRRNSSGLQNPDWEDLIEEDRVENAINIYFLKKASFGGTSTGFLFGDPFPSVTLTDAVFSSEELSHEIGHTLGLFHPHETANGVEQIHRTGVVNGIAANCSTAGDLLCDTPAEYDLRRSTANIDENNCDYIGSATLNGQSYAPDTRNIMSYTLQSCMLYFTQGQGDRMRNFLLIEDDMDNYVIREGKGVAGTISGVNRYYGVEGNIVTSLEHINSNVVYEAGVRISMQPGFSINATDGSTVKARIEIYDCLNPLIRNDAKIGDINDYETSDIHGVAFIEKNGQSPNKEKSSKIFYEPLSISPNPFMDVFNLEFELGKTEAVSLVLHDALGRVVKTVLMNDILSEGYHQYKINGANLEKGLYYVTLRHSNGTQTMKIIKQ